MDGVAPARSPPVAHEEYARAALAPPVTASVARTIAPPLCLPPAVFAAGRRLSDDYDEATDPRARWGRSKSFSEPILVSAAAPATAGGAMGGIGGAERRASTFDERSGSTHRSSLSRGSFISRSFTSRASTSWSRSDERARRGARIATAYTLVRQAMPFPRRPCDTLWDEEHGPDTPCVRRSWRAACTARSQSCSAPPTRGSSW